MRELRKILIKLRFFILVTFFLLNSFFNNAFADKSLLKFMDLGNEIENSTVVSDTPIIFFNDGSIDLNSVIIKGVKLNQEVLTDSIQIYRWTAIEYAQNNDAENAALYIEKYIKSSLRVGFINNDVFRSISNSDEFKELDKKYGINFSFINLFYLFAALIGFFIFIVLNLRNRSISSSTTLISFFVLMHSIFILHLFFYLTNLKYLYPHTLFMSISFSFLYGPIIYFYYKKIALNYSFRYVDLLHLIPTIIIFVVVLPIYSLPAEEKLRISLEVSDISIKTILNYTFIIKLSSLVIYSFLIIRIYYIKSKTNNQLSLVKLKWQRGLARLVSAYVVFYSVYGLIVISKVIPKIDFLYHLQIVAMATMVLYIGYKAYLTPNLFSSGYFDSDNFKYKKSGLTMSFSQDLKDKLVYLLEEEKIYRQNNISLDILSQMLDTTRHNASQVINEHFDLNFFELINKFRIEEALEILQNDRHKNLNIIDIAYEVGFNNKVTFNKSFKKILSQTPSQYIESLSA